MRGSRVEDKEDFRHIMSDFVGVHYPHYKVFNENIGCECVFLATVDNDYAVRAVDDLVVDGLRLATLPLDIDHHRDLF
jgi:hypothetical protein